MATTKNDSSDSEFDLILVSIFGFCCCLCIIAVIGVPVLAVEKKNVRIDSSNFFNPIFSLYSPSFDIFRGVTLAGDFVEHQTGWTSQWTLFNTIQANVEFLAIGWMSVFRMGNNLALSIGDFDALSWASEFIGIGV